MLAQVLIAEADAFVALWKDLKLPDSRHRVVRHGHGPQRAIQTGVGPVEVRRAKARDRGDVGTKEKIRRFCRPSPAQGAPPESLARRDVWPHKRNRAVAGSAPRSGRGGRRFKSCHSDHVSRHSDRLGGQLCGTKRKAAAAAGADGRLLGESESDSSGNQPGAAYASHPSTRHRR
jgi:hypothetical protein